MTTIKLEDSTFAVTITEAGEIELYYPQVGFAPYEAMALTFLIEALTNGDEELEAFVDRKSREAGVEPVGEC